MAARLFEDASPSLGGELDLESIICDFSFPYVPFMRGKVLADRRQPGFGDRVPLSSFAFHTLRSRLERAVWKSPRKGRANNHDLTMV